MTKLNFRMPISGFQAAQGFLEDRRRSSKPYHWRDSNPFTSDLRFYSTLHLQAINHVEFLLPGPIVAVSPINVFLQKIFVFVWDFGLVTVKPLFLLQAAIFCRQPPFWSDSLDLNHCIVLLLTLQPKEKLAKLQNCTFLKKFFFAVSTCACLLFFITLLELQ